MANDDLLAEMDEAARLYSGWLRSHGGPLGVVVRTRLVNRGIQLDNILYWGIGYCPFPQFLRTNMTSRESIMLRAGLLTETDDGLRDPMMGRVVFPQRSPHGDVLGFLGRPIEGSVVKYVSTPTTATFRRREIIDGIEMCRDRQPVVVTEGPFDKVALHRWVVERGGPQNVVSAGTAAVSPQ